MNWQMPTVSNQLKAELHDTHKPAARAAGLGKDAAG
jgi:hypothetical protein